MRPTSRLIEALRDVSIAGIASAAGVPRRSVQAIVDGHVPSVDRAADIAAALGLELRIGPPGAVPDSILAALSLPSDATAEDVLAALAERPAALPAASPSPPPAAPPSPPPPEAGLTPVTDRTLAEILAAMADAWEAADEGGREDLRLRWQTSFPDLARRVLSLSRVLGWLGWRVVDGGRAAGSAPRGRSRASK